MKWSAGAMGHLYIPARFNNKRGWIFIKKIRIGTVEILGYIGIFLWMAVILLRELPLPENSAYIFALGILPNLAAAWTVTMFAKWQVIFLLKREVTVRIHLLICVSVIALALASEIVHDLFLESPFDKYHIIITIAAQIFVFWVPILVKDRYFKNYDTENHVT